MKVTKLPNGGELREYASDSKQWFLNGKRHREDGPAVEYVYGNKEWKEWWVNGERLPCTTQKQFERLMRLKAFW
jgi:hypothetical protein